MARIIQSYGTYKTVIWHVKDSHMTHIKQSLRRFCVAASDRDVFPLMHSVHPSANMVHARQSYGVYKIVIWYVYDSHMARIRQSHDTYKTVAAEVLCCCF